MRKALGIAMALTIALTVTACGETKDSVRAVAVNSGFRCEVCSTPTKKVAATYCVTKGLSDHYLCSICRWYYFPDL